MEWNQMIPEFDVFDLKKSLEFYVDLIGFKVIYNRQEDKFAFLQLGNVQIMVQEIDKENNPEILVELKRILETEKEKVQQSE